MNILSILLLLFCVALFVVSMIKDDDHDSWGFGIVIGFIGFFVLALYCAIDTNIITDFPVEYKAWATDSEVIVYTYADSKYTSDKKKDHDMWMQNHPGFIRKGYNHFGLETINQFVVKPVEK